MTARAIAAGCLLLALLAGGCQSWRTPLLQLALPPSGLGDERAIVQKITAYHGDAQDVMLAHIEVRRASLAMAGTTPDGQLLFQLLWQDGTLTSDTAAWAPAAIRPRQVLSDFQLAFWPADAIRAALPDGWRLYENDDWVRTLWFHDDIVASVRYGAGDRWSQPVQFTHHRWHYRLTIETVSNDPL